MTAVETDRDRLPRYANGAGGWLNLQTSGVEVGPDGELRLQSVPDAGIALGPTLAVADPPTEAPGGCALEASGTGYLSSPETGQVLVLTTCAPAAVAAAGEILGTRPGDTELLPGTFTAPRGLLLGPRGRLYVADQSAVLVIETMSGTVTGRWDDVVEAWCLATDTTSVYVLDRGGAAGVGRVRRFCPDGVLDATFAPAGLTDPVRLAVVDGTLLILDRGATRDVVVPVRLGGADDGTVDTTTQTAWATPARQERDSGSGLITATPVTRIGGLAGGAGRVYLVDQQINDLLTFSLAGGYIGSTRPLRPAADVSAATRGTTLYTLPLATGTLLLHKVDGLRLRAGAFVCGPLPSATADARRELRARLDQPPGTHVQLFTAVTADNLPPTPQSLPGADPAPPPPPGVPVWAALPVDVDVALVTEPTGPQLWVGGLLSGDGSASVSISQLDVSGSVGWLDRLPAIYRRDPGTSDFLDRFLRLVQSIEEETTGETADLVRRFDAWTADDPAPTGSATGALDILAGWLDVDLDERWAEATRRSVVAGAFPAQALRGTPSGLISAIQARFGVTATVTMAAQTASIWSLISTGGLSASGSTSAPCSCHGAATGLGFDTMLTAGPADGAVVGTSAVVGQSAITGGVDVGAPLFADLAHRFHVSAPEYGLDAGGGATALRALIDADKPAHTTYTLCLIGAEARVGVQARVGVDTIVAGPAAPLDLDTPPELGWAALGPVSPPSTPAEPTPAYLGATRLGQGRLS